MSSSSDSSRESSRIEQLHSNGTSESLKPNISRTRLSPIASADEIGDSNQGTSTIFTLKDLNRVASLYPWPKGVTLCLPDGRGDSLAKYPDSLVVYEESLKAGFRLPIPTFVRDFLSWTRLCPAQISPNSWRYFSAYGILCWKLSKEPTFLAMQYLFNMNTGKIFSFYTRNLELISIPSSLHDWKNKWFLVKKGDGYDFDFPIHPGIGVKFRKGPDEMKEIPSEVQELRDAFLSFRGSNLHYSPLLTHENLENAGLSLPHPRQSMKPGIKAIKFVLRTQNGLNSSSSVGASKKRTSGSCSTPGKEEEGPNAKRFKFDQLRKDEDVVVTPVQKTPMSSTRQLLIPTDSPPSSERKPNLPPLYQSNYLTSSVTMEEANEMLKGATVNVDAVSLLKRLPVAQASSEFARDVALQMYHANNLIEKHEKLLLSHLGSHAKLEGLKEEKKKLKQELRCAKESARRNEESMKNQIQSLEDKLKKTEEENAECQKIMEGLQEEKKVLKQELFCAKESAKRNEESMTKQFQSLEDKLKKSQEENGERQKNMDILQEEKKELKHDLLCANESARRNEEGMKKQIQSLEDELKKTQEENADNLQKTQEENAELCQKMMGGLEEEKKELKQELLCAKESSKRNEESTKKQIQSLEDKLKKIQEENAEHQKIMEGLQEEKKVMKQELLSAKESARRKDESMKKQIQSLEYNLEKMKEENVDNLKKTQVENAELCQKMMEGFEEEKKELKQEWLCAKESFKRNEESMKKQIQSLEEKLEKTQEENGERRKIMEGLQEEKKVLEQELLCAKESVRRNKESMQKQIQSLAENLKKMKDKNVDNLKKTQEENAELRQKMMEGFEEEKKKLKQELLCAKKSSKRNEESMKKQILSLEYNLKKTHEEYGDNLKKNQEENAELHQKIMELKMDLSKAKVIWKQEFINSKDFYRRVSHFNDTYYMTGLRVGACQAVKKYHYLDPKIVEFEPDFDDDCGYEVPDPPPYSSPIRLVPYPSM